MYTPSHRGSIRVTSALRRFNKEHRNMLPFVNKRTNLLDSIVICRPENEDPEGWVPPDTLSVIYGQTIGYKIRVGNKFGSIEKVRQELEYLDGEIEGRSEVMQDCRNKIHGLLGAEGGKILAKAEAQNEALFLDAH